MRQGHGNVASVIKAIPQAFQVDGVSSALDSDGEVKHLQACLFEDGLLTQVYADWKLSDCQRKQYKGKHGCRLDEQR